jgi:Ca2+-binding EF-hand superfamily protein
MDAANFVKMCDGDKDGMVSKAEMMKMVEKVWEKADKKKAGKLTRPRSSSS